jgi:hypothetical protein
MSVLPKGDVRLSDGRRLRYKSTFRATPETVEGGDWREGRTGLQVIATVDDHSKWLQDRRILHLSISRRDGTDVDAADFEPVWRAFFGAIPMTVRPAVMQERVYHMVSEAVSVEVIDRMLTVVGKRN